MHRRFSLILFCSIVVIGASTWCATAEQISDVPKAPKNFQAEWVKEGDHWVVHIQWSPKGDGAVKYQLGVDSSTMGSVEDALPIAPAMPGQYTYTPEAKEPRTYMFVLEGLNGKGHRGPPAEVICLAPGRTIAPAILAYVGQEPGSNGRRMLIQWKHPGGEKLKGFRIHMGSKQLAGEDSLKADLRQWVTPDLDAKGVQEFRVEAVSNKGEVSERSPGKKQLIN